MQWLRWLAPLHSGHPKPLAPREHDELQCRPPVRVEPFGAGVGRSPQERGHQALHLHGPNKTRLLQLKGLKAFTGTHGHLQICA